MMNSRREFLALAAARVLWAQRPAAEGGRLDMIVRSARPEDLEMPPSGFAGFITPAEKFFVRTHVAVPAVDLSQWKLSVDGHVAAPLALTIDLLRRMPAVELVSVLECAGNGRAFYNPPVAGLQWETGSVGNGRWRGVRLADILKKAGVKDGAVDVRFDGADVPIGTMADFERAIPIRKALDPDTLLAYEMNGQPLPAKHGFPLRLIVPGWAGDSWAKWVTSIRVLPAEFDGFWMKNAYRSPVNPVAFGSVVPPEASVPVTSLHVKSAIGTPANAAKLQSGAATVISGVAWTGDKAAVSGVDVSLDHGRTWRAARLTGPVTRYGWRLWEFPWHPRVERHYTLLARAKDSSGDAQPSVEEWNPSGYLWNVIARADVDVVANPRSVTPPLVGTAGPRSDPPSNYRVACLACHDEDVIKQQRLTRAQWDREIAKMAGWGARVNPDERDAFLRYLAETYGSPR